MGTVNKPTEVDVHCLNIMKDLDIDKLFDIHKHCLMIEIWNSIHVNEYKTMFSKLILILEKSDRNTVKTCDVYL